MSLNKETFLEAIKKVIEFEKDTTYSNITIKNYIEYINSITKPLNNVEYKVCNSCSGSVKKAHSDFQHILNRWALENAPELLLPIPELTAPYNNDFWKVQLNVASFDILRNIKARLYTDLTSVVRRKLDDKPLRKSITLLDSFLNSKLDYFINKPTSNGKKRKQSKRTSKEEINPDSEVSDTGLSEG